MRKIVWLCLFIGIGLSVQGIEPENYIRVSLCGISELTIELRRTDGGHMVDTRKISSRYKTPEYELRDVTGDGLDEVLVYTRGGGTGCVIDQLSLYAVCGEKLVEAARFNLEGSYNANPGCCQLVLPDGKQEDLPIKEGKIRGAVEFLPDGELLYFHAEAVRDCSELTLDFKVERYSFNSVTAKFERQSR